MNDYSDRVVEFPNRVQLIKVPGTDNIYDLYEVPGTITNPGGTANEAMFKSIDDDIKARLLITSKATKEQAEAGIDDTNYMTALTVKEAMKVNKIIHNYINLSASTDNTINLSQYLTSDVIKLEIIINAIFATRYKAISISGSYINLNEAGIYTNVDTADIGQIGYAASANILLTVFPRSNSILTFGDMIGNSSSTGGTGTHKKLSDVYSYGTLTSISMGAIGNNNYDTPMSIVKYIE